MVSRIRFKSQKICAYLSLAVGLISYCARIVNDFSALFSSRLAPTNIPNSSQKTSLSFAVLAYSWINRNREKLSSVSLKVFTNIAEDLGLLDINVKNQRVYLWLRSRETWKKVVRLLDSDQVKNMRKTRARAVSENTKSSFLKKFDKLFEISACQCFVRISDESWHEQSEV